MIKATWGVFSDPEGGFYAALQNDAGQNLWRSLSTRDERKAMVWRIQAACHGADAHAKGCPDCARDVALLEVSCIPGDCLCDAPEEPWDPPARDPSCLDRATTKDGCRACGAYPHHLCKGA